MTYCAYEQEDFPDADFTEPDENGVRWHKGKKPLHTTLGETRENDIPGVDEAEPDESV